VQHPVTLRVNRESRETLSHYRLIRRPFTLGLGAGRRGSWQDICFRPNYDLLYLDFDEMVFYQDCQWAGVLGSINQGRFDGVQTLEIRNWYMH
jgi:hypothetical protein